MKRVIPVITLLLFLATLSSKAVVNYIASTQNNTGPTPSITLWFNADTNLGQGLMAQMRYNAGGGDIFTGFVNGAFDNSTVAGANWRVTFLMRDDASGGSGTIPPNATNVVAEGAKTGTFGNTGTGFEFTGVVFSVNNGPLPVTYISFTASVENTIVNLNWETSEEANNDFFEIQRSVNAKNFETIGRLKGQLTTAQQTHYSFADLQPNEGVNYYRLGQVDVDGSVNFSKIIAVRVESSDSQSFVLMPNPTTDKLLITNLRSGSNVEVFDLSGQKQKQFTASGLNLLLETKDIPDGMKLIRVTNPDGFSSTKKLMIQR